MTNSPIFFTAVEVAESFNERSMQMEDTVSSLKHITTNTGAITYYKHDPWKGFYQGLVKIGKNYLSVQDATALVRALEEAGFQKVKECEDEQEHDVWVNPMHIAYSSTQDNIIHYRFTHGGYINAKQA